jgi:hypothetical protein
MRQITRHVQEALRPIVLAAVSLSWPGIALAQQSEIDFRSFKLGADFHQPPGFTYDGEIAAGPGIRVDMYSRTYDEDTIVTNGVAVYEGRIVSKLQNSVVPTKSACAEGITLMVEGLMSAGIKNWQKAWREDYQVPVYKADVANVLAKVTCRMKEGIWFLEYTQALQRFYQLF